MQLKHTKTRYSNNFAYHANDSVIGMQLTQYGEYQQREINLLSNLIRHNDVASVVWEVGANIGTHAMAFSKVAKQVVCWEANPQHFAILKLNTKGKLAPNVHCINKAISAPDVETITVEQFDDTVPGNYGAARVGSKTGTVVECRTLDSYLLELPPPSLVKIDVEGHEIDVLKGAIALMLITKPVIYMEAGEQTDTSEHYNMLDKHGYKMWWFGCPNYNPENFKNNTENTWSDTHIFSILAIHESVGGLESIELSPVEGPDDSWTKFCNTISPLGAEDFADR